MANLPIGRDIGSFPHSNGASLTAVGFFFPSVDPKITISAATPPASTKLTRIPTYSLIVGNYRRQYTLLFAYGDTAQAARLPGEIPPIRVTNAATSRAAKTGAEKRRGADSCGSLMYMNTATRI